MRRGVLICVLAALLLPAAAQAGFPGQNGKIAFSDNRDDPNPTGCYPNCNAEIYSVNPDGTGVARLTNDPAYDSTPSWSPDGKKIVFARAPSANFSADVVVMNADGSGETVLDSGFDPSWAPDGSKILYVGFDPSFSCDGDALVTINPDGTGRSFLACASHFGPFAPVWSPDGGLIAYADETPSCCALDVWTVSADGTGPVDHTNDPPDSSWDTDPNWSPDATKVIFHSDQGGPAAIWRMDRDGSNQIPLADPGLPGDINPAYSPDGTQIVFNGINVMSANGGPATFVTTGSDPDWQPIPINSYPRPKGASPMRVSLVTAYGQCTAPNRTHGPPLAFGSCNPPAKESQHLTVGTGDSNMRPARNEGFLRLRTMPGNLGTPADEADVAIVFFSDDIFNLDLTDYTGELRASVPITITDKDNTPHPGGPGAGTTRELDFTVDASCTPVADPQEGSVCHVSTTADALIPGAIKEGRRSVWQLGQVVVYDGGADGDTATAGNTVFARQGVFVP